MRKVLVVGVLVLVASFGIYFLNNKKTSSTTVSTQSSNTSEYSTADVAKHSTSTDCWVIIDNNVYDVTKYQDSHPGGKMNILDYCGKDANTAYKNRGGHGTHSAKADQILKGYLIGVIKQQ